jgi:hypothetical protein
MESNQSYRQFLIHNAETLMNINKYNCENQMDLPKKSVYVESNIKRELHSDLKETEINRRNVLKRLNTPLL